MPDALLRTVSGESSWLLNRLDTGFNVVHFGPTHTGGVLDGATVVAIDWADFDAATCALLRERFDAKTFDAKSGTTYLLRPDRHICARFRTFDAALLTSAVKTALQGVTSTGRSDAT
jgi:3-(3-hydroxy-phenyl)propionate hydroxylase